MNIEHDLKNKRFFINIDKKIALAEYEINDCTLNVTHTKVPSEFSGEGIGKLLMEYAFDYATEHGLKFDPTCSYAQYWLKKHESGNLK